ncbi:helix-turn-helix transcriptional regulator [Paenibacillus sp. NPDC057934]|uniref:helix-turn-helix transcriptional regulator n=1 Tax=Paenibacillus sp. NPDC057934 TaxID=3346282 RepID=UPI0036D7D376
MFKSEASEMKLKKELGQMLCANHLTKREVELLFYWINDHDYREIGDILLISEKTVRKHIQNINLKLGTHSKSGILMLIVLYLLENIV